MAHPNYCWLQQVFETFIRVWQAGGQASLHLHTQDGQARATLDIQLVPPGDHRPGHIHGPQHHLQQQQRRRAHMVMQLEHGMQHAVRPGSSRGT